MAGLARGKIIYGDSSGDPAALAVGSADQVLTHDGTDVSWADAGGGSNTPCLVMDFNGTDQQNNSASSFSNLTGWTVRLDTASMFNTSTEYLTIPSGQSGYYHFNIMLAMTSSSDFSEFVIRLRTGNNGTEFLYSSTENQHYDTCHISATRYLAAATNVQLNIYHNGPEALHIDGDAYKSNYTVYKVIT